MRNSVPLDDADLSPPSLLWLLMVRTSEGQFLAFYAGTASVGKIFNGFAGSYC